MKISRMFKEELFKRLVNGLGTDIQIVFGENQKGKGKTEEVITLHREEGSYSTTFCLDKFYETYQEDPAQLNSMAAAIMLEFQRAASLESTIEDYQAVKDRIRIRLLNASVNHKYLSELPHIPYLDLAVVFYIILGQYDESNKTMIITRDILDMWKKTTEDVYADAIRNMKKEAVPPKPMHEVMMEIYQNTHADGKPDFIEFMMMRDKMEEENGLYLLTNKDNFFGASRMLETDTLQQFSKKLGCSLYLLPSSVHEIMILPDNEQLEPEEIGDIVKKINLTEVDIKDRLSNSIYLFDKNTYSTRIVRAGVPL